MLGAFRHSAFLDSVEVKALCTGSVSKFRGSVCEDSRPPTRIKLPRRLLENFWDFCSIPFLLGRAWEAHAATGGCYG